MKLPLWRIAEFTGAKGDFDQDAVATGYSIHAEEVHAGDLFISLNPQESGPRHDPAVALENGAVAALVQANDDIAEDPHRLLKVEDTQLALESLGAAARRLWGKPLLAVAGSAGKTTVVEILSHLLTTRFRVLKASCDTTNRIGLPLELLKLEPEQEIAVVEINSCPADEMRALGALLHHDLVVLTSVAPVRMGKFHSLAEIARAEYELVETLHSGGVAVLNADDDYICQFGRDFNGKVVTFGIRRAADVSAHNVCLNGAHGSFFDLLAGGVKEPVQLPLAGEHNIYNALAAAAAAMERGLRPSQAAKALARVRPCGNCARVLEIGGATVVDDCRNSNPRSLTCMIDALASMRAERRILIAAEMPDLGASAEALHRECGRHAAEKKIDLVIGVGGLARALAEAACSAGVPAQFLETPEAAGECLSRQLRAGDAVLLKAPAEAKLENALHAWRDSRAMKQGSAS